MSESFAEFLIAAIVMELTPGPNMAWLALLSAREGRRAGFVAVAGIALGLSLLAIAASAGFAALIDTYPLLYEAIRWAGVLFLLYLAFEAWRGEGQGRGCGRRTSLPPWPYRQPAEPEGSRRFCRTDTELCRRRVSRTVRSAHDERDLCRHRYVRAFAHRVVCRQLPEDIGASPARIDRATDFRADACGGCSVVRPHDLIRAFYPHQASAPQAASRRQTPAPSAC